LLVLNGRQGGEDAEAEYWLQLIESFGGDAPVIVVLNKIRETPFDLNRRALQGKYPTVREFIRVDCNPPVGIDDLRRAIHREIDVLTGLRTSFPASWVTIKDRLSNMAERGENYISFERYRELCAELGEKEPLLQEALAGYLHVLGIALNYKDDPRLQDINVLSPHWVTNGIYKILNWPELEANKGVLRLRDLSGVLDPNAYPAAKHMFLLDLMKKFEICFEFPDDPERRYLLPELLGKEDPPGLEGEFDPAQCLNFEYDYNILPEGLLPRFIVRTHRLSEGNARWRTGVILQFEGNRALVKADLHDRKTVISVTGPAAGRRRLLAVIRSDLERIHADIRRLRVTEMVPLGRTDWVVRYSELTVLEKRGILKHQRVFDDKLVELNVRELLDGLDIEGSRSREGELDRPGEAVKVFYSYSHKDEALRDELETHLKLLQRQGVISFWDDRKIAAGEEWKAAINKNLEAAEIILLLISPDFIASDYSYEKEMSRALERHEAGRAQVIPVILRAVDWRSAPFGKLQALPKNGRPVKSWPDTDCAWKDVALGIREAAKARRR
jgi:internalin A